MAAVVVLAGGVGAARFLRGLLSVLDPAEVTAVVNVGDDDELHGLHISPDLDTITYTLAGAVDDDRGWGLRDETWRAMDQLRRHVAANTGAATGTGAAVADWFALGDRDLGTHLYRTSRLRSGARLTEVTAEIARTWGLGLRLLPVSDDPLRTVLTAGGQDLRFQEYFVRERHGIPVSGVRVEGADRARPTPEVVTALGRADALLIAPSNPVLSIEPVLSVPGVRSAVAAARSRTVAVSPIVGGAALKGPADRLLRELGHPASVAGVARWYAPLAGTLVVDRVDAGEAGAVEAEGMRCVVTDTVMSGPEVAAGLARTCLAAAGIEA
jgi:LPPG:FO 2-phospho-L-lactate transferase